LSRVIPTKAQTVDDSDLNEINRVIYTYFDLKYLAMTNNIYPDLSMVFAENNVMDDSIITEAERLEIELKHNEMYGLKYQKYDYLLDISEVVFSPNHVKATVNLTENHDVVFTATAPTISKMRGLEHEITFMNNGSGWLIFEDKYEDYIWTLLKKSNLSKREVFAAMEDGYRSFLYNNEAKKTAIGINNVVTNYVYDRIGARNYAATYWDVYNPNYYNFNNIPDTGDCANFVSQVMHEGGGIPETSDDQPTYGWYYNSVQDYASAWTGVPSMYDFLLNGACCWEEGPKALLSSTTQLNIGDVIIFDMKSVGGTYDHATVVSSVQDMGNWTYFPLVAAHNDNRFDYPFTYYQYYGTYAFRIINDPEY